MRKPEESAYLITSSTLEGIAVHKITQVLYYYIYYIASLAKSLFFFVPLNLNT